MEQEQQEAQKGPVWAAISQLQTKLDTNTLATHAVQRDVSEIKASTNEIVEFFTAAKGAFKVLGWLGTIAKWAAGIVTFGTASYGAYVAVKHGITPADISPK